MGDRRGNEGPGGGREGVLLMRTGSYGEAVVVRQLLATYDIPCQLVSEIAHTVLPICVDGLGEVRIRVAARQLGEASRLVADHRRQGLRLIRGGKRGAEAGPDGG